jgi:AsmA protein
MTTHRLRRYALVFCLPILVPPLIWIGVVLVAPTAWARGLLVSVLEARSGRGVHLDGLKVRWFGGIELTNLEIASPRTTNDPWLRAAELRLEGGLTQLFLGKLEPRSVHVDGVTLRVLRRGDGTLELADFLEPDVEPPSPSNRRHRAPGRVRIRILTGNLTVIDESSKTRLHFQNVEASAVRQGRRVTIGELHGTLNGGPFHLTGELDRTGDVPRFEGRLRASDVVLDDGMNMVRYAVPVLAGASLHLKGHLNSDLFLTGEGDSWQDLRRSLAGHGSIALNPIDLDGAPVLSELSKIGELTRQGRQAAIHSDFVIKDQRISTDHFTVDVGRVPMTLSGWTDFDGRLDYKINLTALNDRLPGQAKRFLGELNVNLQSLQMLTLQGNVNKMVVRLNGIALDQRLLRDAGITREDREKLRTLGRQVLDQLVR